MANVKATMIDIRIIIREFSRGTSLREMERKLKLSRTSLRNYRNRAEASGRSMVDLLAMNDAELHTLSHFIIVAVDGTFAASGLVGADAAVVEAVEGVVEQFAAGWIECTDTYSFISLKSI